MRAKPMPGADSLTAMIRRSSGNGSGASSTALTRLKIAELAPMVSDSVRSAADVNPG